MKLPWTSKCSVRERMKCVSERPEGDQYQVVRHSHTVKSVVFVTAKEIEENVGQALKSNSLTKFS
jgi:hypothetical protein